jgi:protein-disulfide isomerase
MMAGTISERLKAMMETRVRAIWLIAAMVAAGLGGAVLAAGTAAPVAPGDRAAIEKIVHDYIMAHPEIIPEAMARMQSREVEKLLASNRKEIQTPFASAMAGNPDGDVTLVVFFDFACPYCRQGQADVAKLVASDPKLKVVFRDFPVLSPASDEAAMAALSAAQQGKYLKFHDAMFTTPGKVTHERTVAVVRAAGLNEMKTAKDLNSPALKAELKKNLDLGRALGLTGTPSYVVGNQILSGAVGFDELKEAVAEARAAKTG